MVARNRKGRKPASQIAKDLLVGTDRVQIIPKSVVDSVGPELLKQFNEKWAPTLPTQKGSLNTLLQVTRIEVIDATGRVFSQHYIQPGVSFEVQDDGRTIKIFAGEPAQ